MSIAAGNCSGSYIEFGSSSCSRGMGFGSVSRATMFLTFAVTLMGLIRLAWVRVSTVSWRSCWACSLLFVPTLMSFPEGNMVVFPCMVGVLR